MNDPLYVDSFETLIWFLKTQNFLICTCTYAYQVCACAIQKYLKQFDKDYICISSYSNIQQVYRKTKIKFEVEKHGMFAHMYKNKFSEKKNTIVRSKTMISFIVLSPAYFGWCPQMDKNCMGNVLLLLAYKYRKELNTTS